MSFSHSLAYVVSETNEEPVAASLGNLSDTENSDGIRRGGAEVMGSREEGVRADEIETLEEGELYRRAWVLAT